MGEYMKKIVNKLKFKVQYDKKLVLFLIIITVIGILTGSLLVTKLSIDDFNLVSSHLNDYLNNIDSLDNLLLLKNNSINIIAILLIWLLGISVIGLPIIILIYFIKSFVIGFSVGSIIAVFKTKGILFALAYIPGEVINLIVYLILTMFAIAFSFKLIISIIKKKSIDFKFLINKYFKVLIYSLVILVLTSLYNAYLMPNIIKYFIK